MGTRKTNRVWVRSGGPRAQAGAGNEEFTPPIYFPFEMTPEGRLWLLIQIPYEGIKAALAGSPVGGLAANLIVNDLDIVATWKPL